MRELSIRSALVILLIFAIIHIQFAPNFASANDTKLQVAFVGLKYEKLPGEVRNIISWRLNAILESQKSFILTKPDALQILYGRDETAMLLDKQDAESFLAFTRKSGFDHVFSGSLANQSAESDQIILVGELNRYDLATGNVNTYRINNSYEDIGNDLVKFKRDYVESLFIEKDNRSPLTVLALLGVFIVGVIVATKIGSFGGQEDREPPATDE